MTAPRRLLRVLPDGYRDRLMAVAREVSFAQGERIFEEKGRADRFWILRSGTVTLDLRLAGPRPTGVSSLASGDLLGWSWLFPPYEWDFGAEALSPVRAYEFDGASVQELCDEDPAFGYALLRAIAEILAFRVRAARTRLLDLFAPGAHGW
ncbi:cyclic nucleotide-binding domain-containing protein [Streptomyces sp. DSM 44917]|uniref:Cyclic nucleotide-binding domain-containing protein n=1 Tax=Streptomyces boetiae TaxID=3075541 RepID=A0ABU2LF64_9ACTN|nr:cyclic nucleotide-binding domain-containing protein [Streptomyces sp. DSM 44917]MDT0310152.1 cyclic nucleotide-binding domain-containing protein [Streptomyces sp. DSM 44917]